MSQPNTEQAFTDVIGHILHKQLKALLIELLKNAEMSCTKREVCFFPTHLSCKCLSVSASADFPLHYSQSYTVRIDASVSGCRDQRNSRTLAPLLPLLPFFIHCSCTDGAYCFDSVDGEQDVEEGSAHHCW